MRVIAGSCRSLPLKAVPGLTTRPTTDRIKETLFNVLQSEIPGCRFLDLFAGSGAIGIEALSRGASFCAFVESNRKAVEVIRENLSFTKLLDRAEVYPLDALAAAPRLSGSRPFDVVFMDPPYGKGYAGQILASPDFAGLLAKGALVVVEETLSAEMKLPENPAFTLEKEKQYKTNRHLFYRYEEGD